MSLERREVLLAALRGEPTPRFPVMGPGGSINVLTRHVLERFHVALPSAHYSGVLMAELASAVGDMVGFDNNGVPFCLTVEAEVLGARVDMGNGNTLPRISAYPDLSPRELAESVPPTPLNKGRIPQVLRAVGLLRKMRPHVPVVGNLTGPATLVSYLVRPTILLDLMRREPGFLHHLLEELVSFLCAYAEALVDQGSEVLVIHEPVGKMGAYVGIDLFSNVLPYLNEVARYAHLGGAYLVLHLCGSRKEMITACREAHVDAFSFDPEVDPGEASSFLSKPVVGTVPPSLVRYFPPEMVLEEVLLTVRRGASLISPPCGLGLDTPFANLRIMKEASYRFRVV
jgi:[methyl-Co(III) methanol-specific corrinoid protein]:coenzyme M methyltransferase